MEEYDRLGQERFLAEHGFGRATAYLLIYCGRSYDSKAVLGVAYPHATGVRIGAHDFSGSVYVAAVVLRKLGFEIRDTRTSAGQRFGWKTDAHLAANSSVVLTWAELVGTSVPVDAGWYLADTTAYRRFAGGAGSCYVSSARSRRSMTSAVCSTSAPSRTADRSRQPHS
jgi:hypothetical protein